MNEEEMVTVADVARAIILKNGQPIGYVAMREDDLAILSQSMDAQGYSTQPTTTNADGELEYDQQCTMEDPRPCEVNVTLNQVDELAKESGLTNTPVDQLIAQNRFTEAQASAAIQQTIAQMPTGELKENAELWYKVAFVPGFEPLNGDR